MFYTIVGTQWGDEGKGKIVDWLSSKADYVARFQGGNNAGHTIKVDDNVYKLNLLPYNTVENFGKVYVLLDNKAEFLPNELLKVKKPKDYTPKNLYSEDTLEGRLKDLAKAPVIDTGERERLERENEKDLVEKQEKRQKREKKKPKRFLE